MRTNLALLALLAFASAATAQIAPGRQGSEGIREAVEQFLLTQSAGLPGQVAITVGHVDSRLSLPVCAALEPFFPTGSRAWGKTTVGVRCVTPSPWNIFVQATVKVTGEFVSTRVPLAQGQTIGAGDVAKTTADLTALPAGIVLDTAQAVGRTLATSLPSGVPLRTDALRTYPVVQQGQVVRLVSAGPGFQVSAEGRALTNASDGQIVQARAASGQLISGVARSGGVIEVAF